MPTAQYRRRLFGVNQRNIYQNLHMAKSQKSHITYIREKAVGYNMTVPMTLQGPTAPLQG